MLFMGVLSRLNPIWIHGTNVLFIKICICKAFGRDIVRRSFLWRRGFVDFRAKRNICWQFDLERLHQFRWRQLTLKKDVDSMMISGFDWGRIRQFQWRQLFSGRNKSRLFFYRCVIYCWGSMASKFDDADRLTDDERTVFTLGLAIVMM